MRATSGAALHSARDHRDDEQHKEDNEQNLRYRRRCARDSEKPSAAAISATIKKVSAQRSMVFPFMVGRQWTIMCSTGRVVFWFPRVGSRCFVRAGGRSLVHNVYADARITFLNAQCLDASAHTKDVERLPSGTLKNGIKDQESDRPYGTFVAAIGFPVMKSTRDPSRSNCLRAPAVA